uniref:VWFA domain-containing protein n=1 Tax=Onchocerca volvulus TaxID=6282 RepID=A0A8R1XNN7_ONCVO
MDLKFLIVLTFVVNYAVPLDTTPTETKYDQNYDDKILEQVFVNTQFGERIAQYLSDGELKNMANVKIMSDAANFELNRRSRILHLRDGRITPPFLAKALVRISQMNFESHQHRNRVAKHHWSPAQIILFGSEKPFKVSCITFFTPLLTVTSQEDHLIIQEKIVFDKNSPFVLDEIERSPMNGLIIPSTSFTSLDFRLNTFSIKDINNTNTTKKYQLLKNIKEVKLIIVISSDDHLTQEKAENRALRAAQILREDMGSAPICIVTQSDNREDVERLLGQSKESVVLMLSGHDIDTSTLVIDTEDEETLKEKFLNWKRELNFLDSHQIIAFHFTVINGTEPENSEQIFSDVFPDVQLNTLRLLGEPSKTGVNYQVDTEFHFDTGPVYILLGLRKFGYGDD